MKISHGLINDGVVVGNVYNKYDSENPLVRHIIRGYDCASTSFVLRAKRKAFHEIRSGEDHLVLRWRQMNINARGSDVSEKVIDIARTNAVALGISGSIFQRRSIYDLVPGGDSTDWVVCCEVLEHLEDPEAALAALKRAVKNYAILSVPREPLWRILNLARGKTSRI